MAMTMYVCRGMYIKPRFKGAIYDAMSKMWVWLSIFRHLARVAYKIYIAYFRSPLGGSRHTFSYIVHRGLFLTQILLKNKLFKMNLCN